MPNDPSKPCEVCYCIRNTSSCVMQECALAVAGCTPVYSAGSCCPSRYNCSKCLFFYLCFSFFFFFSFPFFFFSLLFPFFSFHRHEQQKHTAAVATATSVSFSLDAHSSLMHSSLIFTHSIHLCSPFSKWQEKVSSEKQIQMRVFCAKGQTKNSNCN